MIKKIIYFFKKIFCRKALRRDAIDKMIEEQEEKTSDKSPSDIEKKEEKEKEPTEEKEKEPTEEEIKEANDKVDNILKYVNKTYEENTKIVNK